jgi:fatty acid-binding protein DegV
VDATYAIAVMASDAIPESVITVIDSTSLPLSLGYLAMVATVTASHGASFAEIIALITDVRDRTHLNAALSTLIYLEMGGRVSNLNNEVAIF